MAHDDFDDLDEDEDSSPFDMKVLLLYGAWRSKTWLAITIGLGAALGFLYAASQPNYYVSRARLDYRPGLVEVQNAEDAAGIDDPNLRKGYPGMMNELIVLNDPSVFERIAEQLGPKEVLQAPDPTAQDANAGLVTKLWHNFQGLLVGLSYKDLEKDKEGSPLALRAASESLKGRTTIADIPRSSVIEVSFKGWSREQAQEYNEVLVQALIDRHREHYNVRRAYDKNKERTQDYYEVYARSAEQYQEHKALCGFVDIDQQKQATILLMQEYERELASKRATREEVIKKLEKARSQLDLVDEYVEEITPPQLQQNPRYRSVFDELVELENELSVIDGQTMAREQREISRRELQSKIEALEDRMADVPQYIEAAPAARKQIPNSVYADLLARINELESDDAGTGAGIQRLEQDLRAQQGKLDRIAVCENIHTRHKAEITAKKDAWEGLQRKTELQRNLADLGDDGQANLLQLSPPTLPKGKGGPQRIKPLGLGLLGGLLLGLAAAVLRQLLDPSVRYPETVEKTLGVKVLGVVPDSRALRKIASKDQLGAA